MSASIKPSPVEDKGKAVKYEKNIWRFDDAIHFSPSSDIVREDGVLTVSKKAQETSNYPQWLPTWDPKLSFEDEPPFSHVDRGFFADPGLKRLFPEGGAHKISNITPKLGSKVEGVQLSQLTPDQKDDLALFVAQRGVVVFRDQDLRDKDLGEVKKFGQHFGPLHIHQTSGAPEGYPEFHITFKRAGPPNTFRNKISAPGWHSDVTYELQPAGITFFGLIEGPEAGGDTLFADAIEAYERLSPSFQKFLDGLRLIHSARAQAEDSLKKGSIQRKKFTSETVHPLIRYHPVLNKRSIFAKAFGTKIVGLKQEESDLILNFIQRFIATALDLQLRASYEPGTVVAWDNRRVFHSAVNDFGEDDPARHCFRITPLAERPVGSKEEYESWSPNGRERTVEEWEDLYKDGIPNLKEIFLGNLD
ncbi:Alpha-ketoglutarate-dependent sulfonate dioxygenase [Komagataella phaffii CBS 7435]|uniref:Fe(II)-dependent sulfonate/alpha-ketoglutarate dioxygenase, involved in sulfonate catabolism for use n=2 Tax=Komagataella phaffii TaxID=460519 RepID=C4QZD9_KOMPG|nr:Fe(II)-dependent sulfonate/alpha-ketoglutarate dioxygenase, involved in sulfonate catabolism for use [Komagataella phaffii GS115]AOA62456.1 GQ67_00041T0 [Komagataella phaffii]CAH2448887.1 Alpha-ketoglutarate-dependent sulfonate dioxygenase [Komagataella phaffii CBS 7435]AOA67805.1 GQ68_01346T0 [Komagataella phaffii GS115]CAY68613.1 Fe(II)-dependent sulfonate/alpha-ketoglutarate dioxygenase, involved in sulfonate catabolism for use [Komagataella phaffii GS115]CCA38964.1 Alpha-ketoglutarate-d